MAAQPIAVKQAAGTTTDQATLLPQSEKALADCFKTRAAIFDLLGAIPPFPSETAKKRNAVLTGTDRKRPLAQLRGTILRRESSTAPATLPGDESRGATNRLD